MTPEKLISKNEILRMLILWHKSTTSYDGDYNSFWQKYPSYSLNNVIEIAEKKLNREQKAAKRQRSVATKSHSRKKVGKQTKL